MRETLLNDVAAGIATYRRAAGLSQAELAARIDRSTSWVSAVEQGRRYAEKLGDVIAIAAVLRCRVEDLTRRPIDPLTSPGARPGGPNQNRDLDAVRTVILRSAAPAAAPGPADKPGPDPARISRRVEQAWATWLSSPTAPSALGSALPGLLTDALACHQHAEDRRAAARALSGVWQAARQWLYHLPESRLAWVAAERGMAAAREADDPHLIALGSWALAGCYRQIGQPDEAVRLCLSTADTLGPLLDGSRPDPRLLAAYGTLHLTAAVSAAQSDQDGRAWAFHRIADQAARSLGDRYDPWTAFGPANVDFYAVAVHEVLGDADAVIDTAGRLDLDAMPSTHRRGCVLINIAQGFARRGEDEQAVRVLLDAEKASRDEVAQSPKVQDTVRGLLRRDRASARPHTIGLARRIGLIPA
jgi:DNA-binding XRE family transcriptional regulator